MRRRIAAAAAALVLTTTGLLGMTQSPASAHPYTQAGIFPDSGMCAATGNWHVTFYSSIYDAFYCTPSPGRSPYWDLYLHTRH